MISHELKLITSSLNCAVTGIGFAFVGLVSDELSATVGAVVSIVNAVTFKADEAFPAGSVTVIVQLLCKPSVKALKVIVLFPILAVVVALEQSPP